MPHENQSTAIITGTASGLGRALAVRLARDDWHLALADVDESGNQETLRLVEAAGGSAQLETLDVSQAEQWVALRERLQQEWPRLDLLINNAGVAGAGEVGEFTLEHWRWLLDINLFGVIHGCHTMLPWLKQHPRRAHIINMASIAPFVTIPGMAAYNVSKAGVLLLTETMHGELRDSNVDMTVVMPTMVGTQLLKRGRFARATLEDLAGKQMAHSKLTPDQVADVAIRAMRRRQLYVLPGMRAKFFWRMKRMMPIGFMARVADAYHRSLKKAETSAPAAPNENGEPD